MLRKKVLRFALPAFAASVLLAGCSGEEPPVASPEATAGPTAAAESAQQQEFNQADTAFAQQMIPHHQQAVEMAEMVASRTANSKVIELAAQIQQAQAPEIEKMTSWLEAWGAPMPMPDMDGMDHGEMPGMMTSEVMSELEQAKDADFDRLWLEMMIEHHNGAIEMSNTQLQQGVNAEAKELAQQIIDAQQVEITTMSNLLATN
ncbi:Uncharacterized conserved protein, DUF305 family [Amycolatopsis marina]|uniref:Uncharacterized conserved protein, DUF305 family n=1 Tax=Amycolatopsis marina TaxID=490629 RepID=A0A1I1C7B1_9PSEU|nr:Uncharacterized conserved protein, DUF305 family [Amycolatopsis marina]